MHARQKSFDLADLFVHTDRFCWLRLNRTGKLVVACPQSCVDCNSDAMFWTCFEMARPLSSTGVVEPDRVPEFRGRVHADLGWLSCLSRFSNAWRYDFFTPQLRHFFRPLQFPVLQWLQLHSRHSPERQDCHSLSDHADCRVAMLFQSYLVTRAKRKLS